MWARGTKGIRAALAMQSHKEQVLHLIPSTWVNLHAS